MAQQTSAHTRGVPPTRGGNGGHVGEAWGEGWRRYATDNSADPNVADFARLVELNPGNSRRHMESGTRFYKGFSKTTTARHQRAYELLRDFTTPRSPQNGHWPANQITGKN